MNDNLQNALAGLADQLGVTTAQLWDWMQGYGIEAYARATIATTIPGLVASAVAVIVLAILPLVVYRQLRDRLDGEWFEFDLLFFALLYLIPMLLIGSFLVDDMSTVLGWMVSPEGMVLRLLMERF